MTGLGERDAQPDVRPVTQPAAHELVVDWLRRAIHLGRYREGEHLPSERDLAQLVGTSRVTLREALAVLERDGYISERRRGGGTPTVLPPGEPAECRRRHIQHSIDDFTALLEFRLAVETEAARLAAQRRDDDDLAAMEENIDAMRRAADASGFRRADSAFHLAVAAAARNSWLYTAAEDARANMFVPLDTVPFEPMITLSVRGHGSLFTAIRAGEPGRAAQAMRRHLEVARAELVSTFSQ